MYVFAERRIKVLTVQTVFTLFGPNRLQAAPGHICRERSVEATLAEFT